jgi:RNA polymerase sigma-70 factor (ECF subfamily)
MGTLCRADPALRFVEHAELGGVAEHALPAETRSLRAWEGHDLDGFVALLKEDATFTMPPWPQWYAGRATIRCFFAIAWQSCRGMRVVPTAANGQPAFAVYARTEADPRLTANAIHVLTLEQDRIAAMTLFLEPRMFEAFGLPPVLAE